MRWTLSFLNNKLILKVRRGGGFSTTVIPGEFAHCLVFNFLICEIFSGYLVYMSH